jgi:membrane-associated protein
VAARILDLVSALGGPLLAVVAFGLAFAESAIGLDLLIPGELGLAVASAAAARTGLPLPVVLGCAIAGGLVGDSAGYWLGRRVGTDIVCRWRWTRRRLGPGVSRATEHFEQHGGGSVFIGRWIGALRAVVPVVAGAARMPYGRFLAWDAAGVVSWTAAVVIVGYRLGEPAADLIDRYGKFISIGAAVLLGGFLVYRHFHKGDRQDPPDVCGDEPTGDDDRKEHTDQAVTHQGD